MTSYFSPSELSCKCGCGVATMSPLVMERLNELRAMYGKAIILNSAYRCPAQNALVGGKSDSAHLHGMAVDMRTLTSTDRFAFITCALTVGFKRIGISPRFTHIDMDPTLPQGVIWTY